MLSRRGLVFTESRLLLKLLNYQTEEEQNGIEGRNLLKQTGILFIHNPKVAGNSLTNLLSGSDQKLNTSHKTPTFLVTKNTWEKYTTVVAIRHPLDRLISSYHYHTKPEYKGVFTQKYPKLKEYSFEDYFKTFSKLPYVIMPQVHYVRHAFSKKPVDYLLRYETLGSDVTKMANELHLSQNILAHLNASKRQPQGYFASEAFQKRVTAYYREDFEHFGYEPNFEQY